MGGVSSSDQQTGGQTYSNAAAASQNTSAQGAQSTTSLLPEQLPFMQQLWGQGGQLLSSDMGIANQARGAWGQAVSGDVNPGVAQVIANASEDMGLDFQRNVLPGIRRGSIGTGSLGGSRQGIAEGLAAGEFARNQRMMSTDLLTRALDDARLERSNALNLSGTMQALPWVGLESFGRTLGGPILQSQGSSSGYSQGTSSNVVNASGYSSGSGGSDSVNVLGKK